LSKISSTLIAAGLLGASLTALAQPGLVRAAAKPAREAQTPQEAVGKVCAGCHSTQIVMDTPKDEDAWHDTIQAMIDRGAKGTPKEFDLVMQYILENVTTVDVNHTDPELLKTVLNGSDAATAAIVARRAQTPFRDLDDLLAAVPGLDAPALRAKKRLLFFN
jgi:DNA uptake protein ComE-like DNA-binding protein